MIAISNLGKHYGAQTLFRDAAMNLMIEKKTMTVVKTMVLTTTISRAIPPCSA